MRQLRWNETWSLFRKRAEFSSLLKGFCGKRVVVWSCEVWLCSFLFWKQIWSVDSTIEVKVGWQKQHKKYVFLRFSHYLKAQLRLWNRRKWSWFLFKLLSVKCQFVATISLIIMMKKETSVENRAKYNFLFAIVKMATITKLA